MSTDLAALEPCPFCGGEAHLAFPNKPNTGFIYCWPNDCGSQVRRNGRAEAIAAWNTRAGHLVEIGPDAVERVARALFAHDEVRQVGKETLDYWFGCDENSHGEGLECKRHCDDLRAAAAAAIAALKG